jgi:hypothetical protein
VGSLSVHALRISLQHRTACCPAPGFHLSPEGYRVVPFPKARAFVASASISITALVSCVAPRGEMPRTQEVEVIAGIFRRTTLFPTSPQVGDSIILRSTVHNRSAEMFSFKRGCINDDQFWADLPLPGGAVREMNYIPVSDETDLVCLGSWTLRVPPGDSATLHEKRWGPLMQPGSYPVKIRFNYGVLGDSVVLHVRVRAADPD